MYICKFRRHSHVQWHVINSDYYYHYNYYYNCYHDHYGIWHVFLHNTQNTLTWSGLGKLHCLSVRWEIPTEHNMRTIAYQGLMVSERMWEKKMHAKLWHGLWFCGIRQSICIMWCAMQMQMIIIDQRERERQRHRVFVCVWSSACNPYFTRLKWECMQCFYHLYIYLFMYLWSLVWLIIICHLHSSLATYAWLSFLMNDDGTATSFIDAYVSDIVYVCVCAISFPSRPPTYIYLRVMCIWCFTRTTAQHTHTGIQE